MSDSLSTSIALAVADETDRDPVEIRPLARSVDPDALERLAASTREMSISFIHEGCQVDVTVDADGHRIDVRRPVARCD